MRLAVVGVLCVLASTPVWAEPVFLQHRVADPLNLLTAIPAYSSPSSGKLQVQVSSSYVNVFSGGGGILNDSDELLVMDGEIGQLELRAQWAINSCYSVGFDSRLISHSGGTFDEEIDAWHQFFQLPDAMRDMSPFDNLTYLFSATGEENTELPDFSAEQIRLETSQRSLGDVWLSVQRRVQCGPARTDGGNGFGHVRMGVKLPTEALTDNVAAWASGGQSAVFLDWHADPYHLGEKARLTTTVGLSYSGEWDERFAVLPRRRTLGYGAMVLDYRWNSAWQSVVQLDIRSPTFRSELREIGDWGAQVHVGTRWSLSRQHQLEFSISEDAVIDTAPDIGVRVAYTYTP